LMVAVWPHRGSSSGSGQAQFGQARGCSQYSEPLPIHDTYAHEAVTGTAAKPHTCSCRMCQRHSGALTTAWVEFPREAVRWTGPGGAPSLYRSSDYSSRAFCPTCGSTLGAVDDAPVVALVLGVFDKPGAKDLMPTSHSFRGARPRWWHVEVGGPPPAWWQQNGGCPGAAAVL